MADRRRGIPEALPPIERGAKYEDPLGEALARAGLGEVTGGGAQMTAPKADGSRDIQWIGVDVELADRERGLVFLQQELRRLGAPPDTVLEYERDGQRVEERLHGAE